MCMEYLVAVKELISLELHVISSNLMKNEI